MGVDCFSGCVNLTTINFGSGLTSTGACFSECTALTTLDIPDNITIISSWAFSGCTALTTVTIPDTVQYVGAGAFYNCTSLVTATIGSGVSTIGGSAFGECTALETVYYNAVFAQNDITNDDSGVDQENFFIANSVFSKSGSADNGCQFIVGDNVQYLQSCLCYSFTNLTSIVIGQSVESMGYRVFAYCYKVETIYYNAISLQMDEDTAAYQQPFYKVSATNESGCCTLILGDSVTNIGSYTFYNMSYITSLTLNSNLVSIGDYAFANCSFTTLTIPDSVDSIGIGAFNGTPITSVYFDDITTWYTTDDATLCYYKSGGSVVDVVDASANATSLKSSSDKCYWYKR